MSLFRRPRNPEEEEINEDDDDLLDRVSSEEISRHGLLPSTDSSNKQQKPSKPAANSGGGLFGRKSPDQAPFDLGGSPFGGAAPQAEEPKKGGGWFGRKAKEPEAEAAPKKGLFDGKPKADEPVLPESTLPDMMLSEGIPVAMESPKPPPNKKKKKKGAFTPQQTAILGVLGVLSVGALIGIGYVFISLMGDMNAAAPTLVPTTVFFPDVTPVEWSGSEPTPTGETVQISTPSVEVIIPTSTPVAVDAVSTRFDLRINRDPNNLDLRLQRGEEYLRLQAYPEALSDFEQAKLLAATRAEPYLGLGRAYFYLRQWNEAETQFSTAVTFNEDMPEPHFWLGLLYYYQGKDEDAARELNQAAELNPEYAEAEAQLTLVYVRMNNLSEAEAAATRAVRVDSKLAMAYVAQGTVRAVQQDIEGAQSDFLYAQKLAPYDFAVLNGIARFYCDYRPERLAEAERLAQQAVRWAKDDIQKAQAYHTLGRVYLALDRKDDAKAALSEAASLGVVDGKVVFPELQDDLNKVYGP